MASTPALVGLATVFALTVACDGQPPTAPTAHVSAASPSVPPASGVPVTIFGTVWAYTEAGVKPLGGGQVFAWIGDGRLSGRTSGPVAVDEAGRYTLVVPRGAHVSVFGRPQYQVCVASATASDDLRLDQHRVLDVRQLGSSIPTSLRVSGPLLVGVVYEDTSGGRQPVADAHVTLDGLSGMGLLLAETRTDGDGRFVLCAVPKVPGLWLDVTAAGYASTGADATDKVTLDVELRRR